MLTTIGRFHRLLHCCRQDPSWFIPHFREWPRCYLCPGFHHRYVAVDSLRLVSIVLTNIVLGSVASAKVPATIVGGQTYVFVTNKDLEGDFTNFSDAAVLFGPAVLEVNPAPPQINYNILKA